MNESERDMQFFQAAIGAGLIAGLRSFSAPAAVSDALASREELAAQLAPLLRLLALGEMFADKMPFMPDRTSPIALIGRAALGGLSGAAVASAYRRSLPTGAAVAAAAAVLSSYLSYYLRHIATEKLGLPDTLVALAEDAVVVAGGRALSSEVA